MRVLGLNRISRARFEGDARRAAMIQIILKLKCVDALVPVSLLDRSSLAAIGGGLGSTPEFLRVQSNLLRAEAPLEARRLNVLNGGFDGQAHPCRSLPAGRGPSELRRLIDELSVKCMRSTNLSIARPLPEGRSLAAMAVLCTRIAQLVA